MTELTTGFFGKLPSHGDFISRELPSHFIDIWDNWLQLFVSSTQTQLADDWLDIYLTSPIWRFCFSDGVIDEQNWAGIMLPSVDRVGRYFPFSIVTRLPAELNPVEVVCEQSEWFEAMENIALQALDGELDLDELLAQMNENSLKHFSAYQRANGLFGGSTPVSPLLIRQESEEVPIYAALLDACLRNSYASYSMWSTRGSEYVEPCTFVGRGLPITTGIAAMLEGQWQEWSWPEPSFLSEPYYSEDETANDE